MKKKIKTILKKKKLSSEVTNEDIANLSNQTIEGITEILVEFAIKAANNISGELDAIATFKKME